MHILPTFFAVGPWGLVGDGFFGLVIVGDGCFCALSLGLMKSPRSRDGDGTWPS